MQLYGLLQLVSALLRYKGRLTYAALQHEFGLDNATLDAIRHELIFAERVATDEAGRVLVWAGEESAPHVAVPLTTHTSVSTLPTLPPLVTSSTTVTQRPTIHEPEAPVVRQEGTEPLAAAALTGPEDMAAVTAVAAAPTRPTPEAERRQLTVMFCDLVGWTTLSGQLDPEDLREVVSAYQETAAGVVQRYDGHIAQYLGDGLLVYFGYPLAHEDDALRAVYTGLDIIDAMATLNTRLEAAYGVQLAVRLGLHTGPVVVGQMGSGGRHEQLALGETPNIAARLEGLAAPNTVVVSAVTAHLVAVTCVLESLGLQELKGVDQPLEVWRIRGLRDLGSIEEAAADERAILLVGRDEELGLLRRRWEQSKEGLGQVVLITGEAGIGKSSLVQVLRAQVAQEGLPRITFRCSPYHTNSALYPVITHLYQVLRFEREDAPAVKLAKVERGLAPYTLPVEHVVPLVAALLSVPLPEGRYPALTLSPQQQRQQTLDALNAWLLAEAERQPLLVLWEDLHWADPTTLELLGGLVDQTPTAALLNVLTFRPECVLPWPPRSHMTPLTLNRLERPQVEALITRLAKGKRLPPEVVAYIVTRADGVPLYVEELSKALLESALLQEQAEAYILTGPLTSVAIPATLQDALMARLDRLSTVREVAQLGAVLGREFPYEMLQALAGVDEPALQDGLAKLVGAELLYQRGRPPRATYMFKHALV
jgi:class 3 adenylate cyclase